MEVSKLREQSDRRAAEEVKTEQRKRNLMILIMHHLQSYGYVDTVTKLQAECNLSLKKITAADNMDLLTILQEYETYFGIKFGKSPKLVKKCGGDEITEVVKPKKRPSQINSEDLPSYGSDSKVQPDSLGSKKKNENMSLIAAQNSSVPSIKSNSEVIENFGVTGTKNVTQRLECILPEAAVSPVPPAAEPSQTYYESKLLKPLPHYESSELRELAATITRDIYMENPNVHWEDIAGLSSAKRLVREAVVYPLRFPDLFTGILSPWKGLLLYGPPGTGKTLLAKAVATECKTTFFNISASSIVSKWRGDSEKLVRVLFELARYHSPSTIFIDEIEAIMGHRTSDGAEHEGSRRMKTELLIQMDGLAKTSDCVFLLAASNLPWDLDVAMLRRLEKRILIDLPDQDARNSMFRIHLPPAVVDKAGNNLVASLDYNNLAAISDGYSGSDIQLVCKEAAMRPLRRLFEMIELHDDANSAPSGSSLS
ncbi:Katanin p60 ATPase-containing subunit A-like 2 [Physocladia obscura]|uniref:Katanin p60 ATPase-containing subunit A-like 2 n=1 Tax=Physocladia obscura TaxID=109957 RepID=A0AAD5XAY4_9FUNG|nr:Katanin p60 ATPase-containing subunit A-like 2 [Physocladia obscura]